MPTIRPRTRLLPGMLAALALAGTVGACGGSDDDTDRAGTDTSAVDNGATTAASDGSVDEAAQPVPQDSDLNTEVRNPDGTGLALTHIAFEGDNILVDLKFVNGSPRQVRVHSTAGGEGALRLVDDVGNAYDFQAPLEEASNVYITVAQGEMLSGTFAFLGPLIGRPEQLRLVTNVAPDEIDSWSLDDEANRGACCLEPGFVVAIDLTWE